MQDDKPVFTSTQTLPFALLRASRSSRLSRNARKTLYIKPMARLNVKAISLKKPLKINIVKMLATRNAKKIDAAVLKVRYRLKKHKAMIAMTSQTATSIVVDDKAILPKIHVHELKEKPR